MAHTWNGMGLLAVAGLLAGCGGGGGGDGGGGSAICLAGVSRAGQTGADGALRIEPRSQPALVQAPALQARSATVVQPYSIRLGDASERLLAASRSDGGLVGIAHTIGFPRVVAATSALATTAERLLWQPTAVGGQVAAISIQSGEAYGLRLGVLVRNLPTDAQLRVYAPGSATTHTIAAADVLEGLARNLAAGDATDEGRTYWTPLVDGTEATLEIELPAGVPTSSVQIAIPRVSHLFASPQELAAGGNLAKAGGSSCEVDVACNTAYGSDGATTDAVAAMVFVQGGFQRFCSGTLLNDSTSSGTPYFLSANHCLSSQTNASNVETYWFFRASSCRSTQLHPNAVVLRGGAQLLYSSAATDTAFLRLNGRPPTGAVFAGWSVQTPVTGSAVASLHHPGTFGWQAISTGVLDQFYSCGTIDSGGYFECFKGTAANGNFVNATFSVGTTESGSSGGPLFEGVGGRHYLVGQLYGGNSSCDERSGSNVYGRFDVAYNAALRQWLSPSTGC